nr:retrovirus-related Pol polyprotein from transposon TNT 1-94 [Tanacetum cinerariifolium]
MQTQTSNTLHNAIMEAGGKDRLPMLASDKTVLVSEGSFETTTETYMENYKNVSQDIHDQLNAEAKAVQIILIEIDNDIYSIVDACPNAYGESLESYFSRFYKMMNELVRNQCDVTNHQVNVQFLLQLQPEWQRGAGYENQRLGNVDGARETVDTTVVQKSRIQCYNYKEFGHVARECQKPKRAKDATYHREKMLLFKQEEAGIQLNTEQADWRDDTDDESEDQELEAHYMYMAQIQEVSLDAADSGPSLILSHHKREHIDQDDNDDLVNKRALLASLIKKLKCEINDSKNHKELDKVIALENKVKVLDNIVYKTGQSVQTMNMLNSKCKTSFAKPEFLKKAQRANPRLYDIGCYYDNLALMLAPEFDEVIRLEKECRSKLSDLIRPFDYDKLNNLYDLFVPQSEKSSEQRYFSSRSKRSHTPVNNDLKAQLQDKCIAISELKKLVEKLKGKSMDTKFEKSSVIRQPNAFKCQRPSILGKPTIFSDSLERKDFSKLKSVTKNNVSNDFSKPVTAQILPSNKKSILKNTNVVASGMYKLHTKPTQTRTTQLPHDSMKTDKRVSFSIGVIPTTSVSRQQLRAMESKIDVNAKTLKVNFVYATCGKCVLNEKHDMCVLKSRNGANSSTKMPIDVPVSTREPKRIMKQSVAKPFRQTVASESTNQKPRNTTRKLYERVSKACSWWYPKFTPTRYKWEPKSKIGNVNLNLIEIILFIIDSRCSKHITGNLKLLINFVEKFLGTVKFGNDQIAPILGYGDLVHGAVTIKHVYYVEGLNHNLFSISQFCDADLEVAFWNSTSYIRNLKGNDLLTGSCGTDLYSITLQDKTSPNLICLMAKVTSSQAWLWHRRLSHLNFDTINLLSKNDIVIGLPKLKFIKDNICSSCELGKVKRKSFQSKTTQAPKDGYNFYTWTYVVPCG